MHVLSASIVKFLYAVVDISDSQAPDTMESPLILPPIEVRGVIQIILIREASSLKMLLSLWKS